MHLNICLTLYNYSLKMSKISQTRLHLARKLLLIRLHANCNRHFLCGVGGELLQV